MSDKDNPPISFSNPEIQALRDAKMAEIDEDFAIEEKSPTKAPADIRHPLRAIYSYKVPDKLPTYFTSPSWREGGVSGPLGTVTPMRVSTPGEARKLGIIGGGEAPETMDFETFTQGRPKAGRPTVSPSTRGHSAASSYANEIALRTAIHRAHADWAKVMGEEQVRVPGPDPSTGEPGVLMPPKVPAYPSKFTSAQTPAEEHILERMSHQDIAAMYRVGKERRSDLEDVLGVSSLTRPASDIDYGPSTLGIETDRAIVARNRMLGTISNLMKQPPGGKTVYASSPVDPGSRSRSGKATTRQVDPSEIDTVEPMVPAREPSPREQAERKLLEGSRAKGAAMFERNRDIDIKRRGKRKPTQ